MNKSLRSPEQLKLQEILRRARESAGLTQAALAARLRKPQSFVAKYEIGERRLDVIELVRVLRATKQSFPDLVTEIDKVLGK